MALVSKPYQILHFIQRTFHASLANLHAVRETISPLISTSAALLTLGTVSSIDLPEVVTSSIMTTLSPSFSLLPKASLVCSVVFFFLAV